MNGKTLHYSYKQLARKHTPTHTHMYNMCRFAFGIDHETNVYGCVGFTTRCKVLEDPTVTTLLKKLCVDSFDLRPTRGYLRESRSYHRFLAPESGARAAIFAKWFENGKWFVWNSIRMSNNLRHNSIRRSKYQPMVIRVINYGYTYPYSGGVEPVHPVFRIECSTTCIPVCMVFYVFPNKLEFIII